MDRRSSTSSSDPRRTASGVPWALLLALAMLGLVELGMRLADPAAMIPYRIGKQEYQALHDHLHAFGAAEVCFVGSSRAREAIVVPLVRQRCGEHVGESLTAANYSLGGARVEEIEEVVARLLVGPRPPRVIFWGLEPRQVLASRSRISEAARTWALDDWRRGYQEHGGAALRHLPGAVRNQIGRHYRTFQYRQRLAILVDNWAAGESMTCPMRGELTPYQRHTPEQSLVSRPISDEHVADYVASIQSIGELDLAGDRTAELAAIIDRCHAAGVRVVLFETPVSNLLARHRPVGVRETFRRRVGAVAASRGVRFVTVDELAVAIDGHGWLEQSHLNYQGAKRFTEALLDRVVQPTVAELWRAPPSTVAAARADRGEP